MTDNTKTQNDEEIFEAGDDTENWGEEYGDEEDYIIMLDDDIEFAEFPPKKECRVKDFIHELILNEAQLQEMYDRFTADIEKALKRKTFCKAELKCHPTYIQDLPDGQETGKFLVLDFGGQNFRILLVVLNGDQEPYVDFDTYQLDTRIMTGPAIGLFDHLAKCLDDFILRKELKEETFQLGFTFSFPYVQKELTKATLLRWTKGFSSSGVVNRDVCRLLREGIARRTDFKIDIIAILNDTTACLMLCAHRNAECRIGVIVDNDSSNACYIEKVENIEQLEEQYRNNPCKDSSEENPESPAEECTFKENMIVNTEWGAFGDKGGLEFIRTGFDELIDRMSANKGSQIFEKMVAGVYLGELVRIVLLRAVSENLMFTNCCVNKKIANALQKKVRCFEVGHIYEIDIDVAPEYERTREIIKSLFGMRSKDISEEDCEKLKLICGAITRRAAFLIGVALSSLINKMELPHVVVAVDGAVYKYHLSFDSYMREIMKKFVNPETTFDIVLSEDGAGLGAGIIAAVVINNIIPEPEPEPEPKPEPESEPEGTE